MGQVQVQPRCQMIDYAKILSSSRLRTSTQTERTILTESESDRGRVLFSPAFRRLQQKAQVFSMEPNAAVRSRLTHSFEVSQLGRYLADEIGQRLADKKMIDALEQSALVNFVETACLMHDIGNPPFGHFGEAAIQEWFRQNGKNCLMESIGIPENHAEVSIDQSHRALADFHEFDGNPQGLRIVTRLQWNTDAYGLNLTKTSLGAFLKYVRSPTEEPSWNFTKKPGFFITEEDIVKQVWQQFGYDRPQRFPLAYIMEAADDIAYCISDLEDSFEKKIIQEEIALPNIEKRYQASKFPDDAPCHADICRALKAVIDTRMNEKEFTYTDFRTMLSASIVRYAAQRFADNQDKISSGELNSLLPEDEPPGCILKVLKDFCREYVYTHESIQRVEIAGFNAISGLLNQFRPLLTASRDRFEAALRGESKDREGKRILVESKLLKLFPPKYLKVYHHQLGSHANGNGDKFTEWNARAHLVVDFISGMTDDFAMTTYRTLAGIRF